MPEKSVRIVIEGRVQAVWFRAWTTQEAQRRNLRGWVRNRPDGTVEALFSGAVADVDEMIEACRQGPPAAQVVSVDQALSSAEVSVHGASKRSCAAIRASEKVCGRAPPVAWLSPRGRASPSAVSATS